MDAVGGTASIFRLLHQFFSHIKQARRFEDEFRIYQLHLQMHLSRCASVSRIIHDINGVGNCLSINAIDGPPNASQDQEPSAAEILSAIQDALREAQREAAQIRADCSTQVRITGFLDKRKVQATKTVEGVKWAIYKRDNCNKFIEEISCLILHLERQVDREWLTLGGDTGFLHMARPW